MHICKIFCNFAPRKKCEPAKRTKSAGKGKSGLSGESKAAGIARVRETQVIQRNYKIRTHMKHIYSVIMALVTSMTVLMPSNTVQAQSTGGDGSTISLPIAIDGEFNDWTSLEQELPNVCVSASSDDNARYTGLYKVLFFANNDSLFFYIEYSNSKQVQESSTNYFTNSINILLNTDGSSATGESTESNVWTDMSAADVMLSGTPRGQFANAVVAVYQGSNQTWETVQLPVSPISACTPVEEATNDHAKIEGAIALSLLPVEPVSLQVGVMSSDGNGERTGALPQVTTNATDGGITLQPMLSVPLSGNSGSETISDEIQGLTWTYVPSEKTLVITGNGDMWDSEITPGFAKYKDDIKTVFVNDSVTSVSGNVFSGYDSLHTVILANTVTEIGNNAFSDCGSLSYLALGEGVKYILGYAFYGCHSLMTLTLPGTLEGISEYAFAGCTGLTSITCLGAPASLDNNVFQNVPSTIPVLVPDDLVSAYQEADGWSYFTNIQAQSSTEPASGMCGKNVSWTYTPLAKMLQINGRGAMDDFEDAAPEYFEYQNNIQYVMVESGVTYVGSRAFAGMTSLLTANLDSSITSMGTYVFDNCTTLQYLQLPQHMTSIPEGTFYSCNALQGIEIPASITSIGGVAFYECSQLQALVCYATTPPTLDANVFDGVPNSIPLYVPAESLSAYRSDQGWSYFTDIQAIPGETSYEDQSGMCGDKVSWELKGRTMTISGGDAMWDYSPESPSAYSEFMERIDTVIIESGVTKVGDYAFSNFSSLTFVALPTGLKTIGGMAFLNCTALTYVEFPQDLTNIGDQAFRGCENLVVQPLPETLFSIGTFAFENCHQLQYLTMPNSVRYIGHDAFAYCSGLQEVLLPELLDEIQPNTFAFCSSLNRVRIPASVTTIGDNAFILCRNLPGIVLPDGVKEIYGGAFSGCSGLQEMQCEAVVPPALVDAEDNPVFNNVPSTIPLYVRAKSVKIYQRTEGWNYFENIQPIDGDSLEPTEVTIFGITITPGDSTSTDPIDLLGDSTIVYDPADNTLSFNGVDWSVGEEETVAINYTGDEALTIVLNDSSTIMADTIIASTADITITGDGHLVAEGVVPIIGVSYATITFDSVNMYVRSVPSPQALRRRIRYGKKLDENGGPALSGFASADFNKTAITPPDAEYGEVEMEESAGGGTINALYTENENGDKVIVTEFTLTANDETGVENVRVHQAFDPTQPMYNVLGIPVDATYKGIVIQNGQTFLLR